MDHYALVGCAHIHTPGFIEKLKQRTDLKVTRVWDPRPDRAAQRAKELDAQVAPEPQTIWKDESIRAVVICSETNLHEELVQGAVQAGKHLFVEKPLGFAGKDALAMARAIENAGLLFQTGYFMRSSANHQWLKKEVDRGSFGIISRARHSNAHSGSLGRWFDTDWRWMADPKIAGCGGFGDLGTHSLDILMWLLGDVKSVAGDVNVVVDHYDGCDESGEALIKFESGALASVAGAWVDVANPFTCMISGTQGYAHIHDGKLYAKGEAFDGEGKKLSIVEDLPPSKPHAFDLFLDAVTRDDSEARAFLVSPTEAAARSIVMSAIYESSRERGWIEV